MVMGLKRVSTGTQWGEGEANRGQQRSLFTDLEVRSMRHSEWGLAGSEGQESPQ